MRTVTKQGILTVYFDNVKTGWSQTLFLSSDRHHDSPGNRRDLELKHLKAAQDRGAYILDAGDLFDAMQGPEDPRKSASGLRPEFRTEDYFGDLVRDAADFYAPFAHNFLMLGEGNHETAVLKHWNFGLTTALVETLKYRTGAEIFKGTYAGYVRFLFEGAKPIGGLNLKYHHGSGAEAAATKGIAGIHQTLSYTPDADILWSGHNHSGYIVPIRRSRLSGKGVPYSDICYALRTPGYNDSYGNGQSGWEVEKGHIPKPLGGIWVEFYFEGGRIKTRASLEVE